MSWIACLLIVLLRIAIGWQFVYEGLWKLNTQSTSNPWSAAGYLKNAKGPLRDHFRNLTGDPNDLDWLDHGKMATKWDVWYASFRAHFDLTDDQQKKLHAMLNGSKAYYASLAQLPDGVEFRGSLGGIIKFDAERKRLEVDGKLHLTPPERDRLLSLARIKRPAGDDAALSAEDEAHNKVVAAYHKAVRDVFARSSRPASSTQTGVSFKERLSATLVGDPERAGLIQEKHKGTIDYKRMGDIELYKKQLHRYEENLAKAKQSFQHAHLKRQWTELQQLRARLIGPVKALENELTSEAKKLLTADQKANGPVSLPLTQLRRIDVMTMWALVILGALLILGLFSRLAAVGAALLLLSFYLAFPPWPGVIDFIETLGPEHSFIVDKNLIEVVALLGIAAMPTGRWIGLDALVRRFILRKRTD